MRIAYENYMEGSIATNAIYSIPTASSSYSETNLYDQRLTTKWGATSTASQALLIDLSVPRQVTTYAILGHNISPGATVTFAGGSTTACTAVVTTITWNENIMLAFASAQTYQYWKLTISGNAEPIRIGRVWIGDYITIDPASLLDFTITKKTSDNVSYHRSRGKYASKGITWRKFSLKFPVSSSAMIDQVCEMYDYAQTHNSIIFCNFDTDRSYQIVEPCYCSITNDIDFGHVRNMRFDWALELEEDL